VEVTTLFVRFNPDPSVLFQLSNAPPPLPLQQMLFCCDVENGYEDVETL
jgi:hypothetical protein